MPGGWNDHRSEVVVHPSQTVWATTSIGLFRLKPQTGEVTRFPIGEVGGISCDNRGYIWVTFPDSNKVKKFDYQGNQVGPSVTVGSLPFCNGDMTGYEAGLQREHDVRPLYILAPKDSVALGSYVTPKAVVKNVGSNTETFPVVFQIASFYCDTVIVGGLAPGDTAVITFDNWLAQPAGTYLPVCYTDLVGDEYRYNDTCRGFFIVRPDGPAPEIYSVTPDHGGNTGIVTVTIAGAGFLPSARVKLTRMAQPDIAVDSTRSGVIDSSTVVATMDLRQAPPGLWNVVVTNPGGGAGTFYGGFTIEVGREGFWADIVAPSQLRVGRDAPCLLTYGNSGNIDVEVGLIIVSPGLSAVISSQSPLAWPADSVNGGSAEDLALLAYNVPAGFTGTVTFQVRATAVGPIQLGVQSWIVPSENGSPSVEEPLLAGSARSVLEAMSGGFSCVPPAPPEGHVIFQDDRSRGNELATGHEGLIWHNRVELPSSGCDVYVWENLPQGADPARPQGGTRFTPWEDFSRRTFSAGGLQEDYNPRLSSTEQDGLHAKLCSYVDGCADGSARLQYNNVTLEHCTWATQKAFKEGTGRDLLGRPYRAGDSPAGDFELLKHRVWPGRLRGQAWKIAGNSVAAVVAAVRSLGRMWTDLNRILSAGASWDPNGKAGPIGFGDGGFLELNEPLHYIIFFENDSSATAAAESIWVADTLDSDLDWSTLILGDIFPGAGPDDIRPSYQAATDFNPVTGVITWTLSNINLPPDTMPYWGEGWVSYSVKPRPELPTGTRIENIAAIKFDENPWILAPMDSLPIFNTIDAAPPSSNILTLADSSSARFSVNWTGLDDDGGSGIASYSIYYSTDGTNYDPWIIDTSGTSGMFSGETGTSYYFYSVARDNVGHVETFPVTFDAHTTVTSCCVGRVGNANGVGTYPQEVTIGDIQTLVTAKFIQGTCTGYVQCLAEGDANQSGGPNPTCNDITISDIQTLVNHLFIAGPANAPLKTCL
jgi:hypothetical protein